MLRFTAHSLDAPTIAHGFFGRTGGVSEGIYASLNCGPGSGDDLGKVTENRRRVEAALGQGVRLVNAYQIHSGIAHIVKEPWALGEGPQGDAMATATQGVALGILTADCAPVLFADPDARVIGAAHAGWKGAFCGVLEATIAAMEKLGAERSRIRAAIGPCISQENYEVGAEFRARFTETDATNAGFFVASDRPDHFCFALEAYALSRLEAAGIAAIEPLSICTYAGPAEFFSYRRATHRGESAYGRQVSAITLI